MVDFSCALKLAMPISVLVSDPRSQQCIKITVKGGKFLEAVAEADTIVFDKTGTLTKAKPTVVDVVSFNGMSARMNFFVLQPAWKSIFHILWQKQSWMRLRERILIHEEMHSKVEYIVAHGISTTDRW